MIHDSTREGLFSRTNDLRDIQTDQQKKLVNVETKLDKLCAPQTNSISVHRTLPQFAKSTPDHKSRPEQFTRPRVRVCYNCRRPGHLAACYHKPNPRTLDNNAPESHSVQRTLCDVNRVSSPVLGLPRL